MKKRRSGISSMQKRIMFDFLKDRPLLVSGKYSATFKYTDAEKCWMELTYLLNSVPGPHKEWKNWRKTWQDLRSKANVKNRRIEFRAETKLPNEEYLTQTEQSIVNLIQASSFDDSSNSGIKTLENDDLHHEFTVISKVDNEQEYHNEINVCEKCNTEMNENENSVNDETLIIASNNPEEPHKIMNMSGKEINFKNERIEIVNEKADTPQEDNHNVSSINRLTTVNKATKSRTLKNRFMSVKRQYHSKKLKLLERLLIAKERSAAANERSAAAKEQIAASLGILLKKLNH